MPQSVAELDLEFGDSPVYTRINDLCNFSDWHGVRNVNVKGHPLFRYNLDDKEAEKLDVVFLFREGWAQQKELSAVLGCHESTLRGWTRRIEKDGIVGAARKKRRSPLLKMGGTKDIMVTRFFHEGLSNYAIGRRLGVGEHAVRLALKRLGLKRKKKAKKPELKFSELEAKAEISSFNEVQKAMENKDKSNGINSSTETRAAHESKILTDQHLASAQGNENESIARTTEVVLSSKQVSSANMLVSEKESEKISTFELPELIQPGCCLDSNPEDRSFDRWMATLGLVNDAAPLFRPQLRCWGVGALLAVPFLVEGKILEAFQKVYGKVPGFFGLRNSVMSLLFMAFLRIKRIEQLKEKNPQNLGGLLGLDRLPEAKTLRRKITYLASLGKGLEFMRVLAKIRMRKQQQKDLLGFLYVDGHVKEYHGNGRLGKTYIACRHCVEKGSTDVWVHDAGGTPVFVVPCELNQSLSKMLERVLDEVEKVVGDRRMTIIFDRGG